MLELTFKANCKMATSRFADVGALVATAAVGAAVTGAAVVGAAVVGAAVVGTGVGALVGAAVAVIDKAAAAAAVQCSCVEHKLSGVTRAFSSVLTLLCFHGGHGLVLCSSSAACRREEMKVRQNTASERPPMHYGGGLLL